MEFSTGTVFSVKKEDEKEDPRAKEGIQPKPNEGKQ